MASEGSVKLHFEVELQDHYDLDSGLKAVRKALNSLGKLTDYVGGTTIKILWDEDGHEIGKIKIHHNERVS